MVCSTMDGQDASLNNLRHNYPAAQQAHAQATLPFCEFEVEMDDHRHSGVHRSGVFLCRR
jgi:hypothetical protein